VDEIAALGGGMTYVPSGAKWYWAEVIVEINVEDDPRNVVHRNLVLVQADSPMGAYERATEIGKRYESSDLNPSGKIVRITFRGLGGLDVIHDKMEHGAEILYSESISVSESQINQWVRQKNQLDIFREDEADNKPDYSSKEIGEEVHKILDR
jgi:hypothetical protein